MSEFKKGDRVWVQGIVIEVRGNSVRVARGCGVSWWMMSDHCRPVEPANSSEIPNSSSDPLVPSPCMDGVDVDEFVEGVMEARGRTSDPVNPSHYKQGGIECIEAIKAATGDGFVGYVWGNVLKYLWRWPKKGGVDDLKKARWYLDRLIQEVGE